MSDASTQATYHWHREACDRVVDAGLFGADDRLELIDEQLLSMSPQGSRHAAIVEVSDDSLRRDRTVKQRLHARHGVPEYWILALPDARLEVYRDPGDTGYRSVTVHRAGETVGPLARPAGTIAVGNLLP